MTAIVRKQFFAAGLVSLADLIPSSIIATRFAFTSASEGALCDVSKRGRSTAMMSCPSSLTIPMNPYVVTPMKARKVRRMGLTDVKKEGFGGGVHNERQPSGRE